MSIIQCPHCRGGLEQRPELSLQLVQCPYCAGSFQMPPYQQLVVPQAQMPVMHQAAQPSVVMVSTAPRREPRLRARGWFSNSLGVSAAFFLCFFGFVVAVCGGGYYWTRMQVQGAVDAVVDSAAEHKAKWKGIAKQQLARFGYPHVADDAALSTLSEPNAIYGTCQDKQGRLLDYRIEVKMAQFGKSEKVRILSVEVDGQELFREPASREANAVEDL